MGSKLGALREQCPCTIHIWHSEEGNDITVFAFPQFSNCLWSHAGVFNKLLQGIQMSLLEKHTNRETMIKTNHADVLLDQPAQQTVPTIPKPFPPLLLERSLHSDF